MKKGMYNYAIYNRNAILEKIFEIAVAILGILDYSGERIFEKRRMRI